MVQHEMFMTAPATHVIGREPMSRFGNNLGATFRVTARCCTRRVTYLSTILSCIATSLLPRIINTPRQYAA